MDLKQLEAFVSVVKLNSFSKAADLVFLSQPTVSAHISSLEKELDAQLLIRSTREVYPTRIGMELYGYAVNMLAMRDQALQAVKGYSRDSVGEVNVIASSVPAQYLLPEALAQFHRQYPNILVHIHQSDSGKVGEKLRGYYHDFGIAGTQLTGNRYVQQAFYKDTMVIACPSDYVIDKTYTAGNLASFIKAHPFIMRECGSGTLYALEKYLSKNDLTLNDLKPAAYFSNTQGVLHAVANGLGISFVSSAAASMYAQMGVVKTIEIDPKFFYRSFYLLRKKDMALSPIQELFQKYIIDYYLHTFN